MLRAACRKAHAPEPRRWRAESLVLKRSSAPSSSLEKIRSKPAVADFRWAIVSSVGERIAIEEQDEGQGAVLGQWA